jgi:serine/threonine protein phosphatase PrpC
VPLAPPESPIALAVVSVTPVALPPAALAAHTSTADGRPRRPSLVESLAGIMTYVTSSIAPFHESHPSRRESLKISAEIGTHVDNVLDNVLTTITQAVAPMPGNVPIDGMHQSVGDGGTDGGNTNSTSNNSDPSQNLFPLLGDASSSSSALGLLSADTDDEYEYDTPNAALVLQRQVFDALVDTRTQDIAYEAAMSETKEFFRGFFKLLGKDHTKYTAADWEKLEAMLKVEPDLIWQRVVRDTKSTHKRFEETFAPLHCAAAVGHEALCRRLYEFAGTDISIVDKYGRQPLHIAAYYGHADMCNFLSEKILEVTGKRPVGDHAPVDVAGWTPAVYSMRGRKARKLAVHNEDTHGSEQDIQRRVSEAESERDALKQSGMKTREVREQIEGLEKNLLSAKFGRCKDLLYAHGDHHISPKSEHKTKAAAAVVALRSSPFSPFSPQRRRAQRQEGGGDDARASAAVAIAGAAILTATGRVSDSPLRTRLRRGLRLQVPLPKSSPLASEASLASEVATSSSSSAASSASSSASSISPTAFSITQQIDEVVVSVSGDTGILNVLARSEQEQAAAEAIAKSCLVVGCSHHHMTGMRLTNEDEILIAADHEDDAWALFAVFDGHGGDFTAGFLRRQFAVRFRAALRQHGGGLSAEDIKSALLRTAVEVNKALQCHPRMVPYLNAATKTALTSSSSSSPTSSSDSSDSRFAAGKAAGSESKPIDVSGAVGVVAVVTMTHIVVANVGDARCMLQKRGAPAEQAVTLTVDHDGMNEAEKVRITSAGGYVHPDTGCVHLKEGAKEYRQPTRAWGDFSFAPAGIICTPEFTVVERSADGLELLVLGCDGVFEGKGMDTGTIFNQVATSAPLLSVLRAEKETVLLGVAEKNGKEEKYATPRKPTGKGAAVAAAAKTTAADITAAKPRVTDQLNKACEDVLLLGLDSGTTDNQSICIALLGRASMQTV